MSRARFQNLRTKMGGFSTEARRWYEKASLLRDPCYKAQ